MYYNGERHKQAMITIMTLVNSNSSSFSVYNSNPNLAEAFLKNNGYTFVSGKWVKSTPKGFGG